MNFIQLHLHLVCRHALLALMCFAGALFAPAAAAQVTLQDIGFAALPDTRFEIALTFSAAPPTPEVFVIEQPARLTMDFANVTSQLTERRYPLTFAGADSVMILEAQGRTRMVVNLTGAPDYTTRVQGNALIVSIAVPTAAAQAVTAAPAPQPTAPQQPAPQQPAPQQQAAPQAATPPVVLGPAADDIAGIDFRGGAGNAGEIVITLGRAGLEPNISRNGDRLDIEFENASINAATQTRLDVRDFATPVEYVSLFNANDDVIVQAQIEGQVDYVASQIGNQFIVSVTPEPVAAAPRNGVSEFTGDPISLIFQDVEVRSVLQILAEFNNFSLVVPDSVTGNITLQLEEVPWDQALDIVLRSRNLDKRLVGTVLYVAPAAEIATAELAALESSQQADTLAPLVTDYIEINYAVAGTLLELLQGSGGGAAAGAAAGGAAAPVAATTGGVLSPRGRASVDARTNTIIIQDTQEVIDNVRSLIARLDVPVRQVLIEARIVNASTTFSQALGVRWGGAQTFPGAGDQFVLGGSIESTIDVGNNLVDFNTRAAQAVVDGTPLEEFLATNAIEGPTFPQALVVDFGVPEPATSIALGYAGNNSLLQLELSALEASGNGEVIAQPKVTTQDQQTARIESGLQIPYQAQAGGTAGGSTTEFVTAALSLEVTPQITPDGRIIMLLDIHQDSVVPGSGAVPAIATNSVNTRVLVNNGDTVVLGGVFREETTTTVTKTPLLGDLPYVGNLFKRTEESENKTELLIFITPSIINEIL
ncbi:MAG: type IV pilus secretin PilQ [Pseudomonadota bacterium]|nr:type IV pilus secretin PilQ [Pseudomonadota bacterium]